MEKCRREEKNKQNCKNSYCVVLWMGVVSSQVRKFASSQNLMRKFFSILIYVFGAFLGIFSILKVAEFLYLFNESHSVDPLFVWIPSNYVLLVAGMVEFAVVVILLSKTDLHIKYLTLTWLLSIFTIYRISLKFYSLSGDCACAGSGRFLPKYTTLLSDFSTWLLAAMWIVCVSFMLLSNFKLTKMSHA